MTYLRLLSAVGLLAAAACSQTDSDGVLTTAVHANFTLSAKGDGTSLASGTLRVGGSDSLNYLNLVGDDRLTATIDGTERAMGEVELLDVISYTATFDEDAADTAVTFALERSIDAGAPSSTVTLPAPFTAQGPASGSRGEDLQITFSAASQDPMAWEVHGPCVTAAQGTVPTAAESVTIGADMIVAVGGQEAETCDIEVTVTATRQGTLDPAFEGGTIVGEQARTVTVSSTP